MDGYQSWADYLTDMERDGTWGDHVILCAAANCYETCIHVISSLPQQSDVIIRPCRPVGDSNPLMLGHVHEIHYVSLQPIQGKTLRVRPKAKHAREEKVEKSKPLLYVRPNALRKGLVIWLPL